jgi:sec-independent protein translocase protein TatA
VNSLCGIFKTDACPAWWRSIVPTIFSPAGSLVQRLESLSSSPLHWQLDGAVDCKAGNPLYRALVNLPIALSMPGWPETIFILIVVVLLFGAKKLPELARGLGQSLGEFKKARDEFERELRNSTPEVEVKTPADKPPHQPSPEPYQGSVHAEGVVSGSKETEKPA